jgi:hypothetical protein
MLLWNAARADARAGTDAFVRPVGQSTAARSGALRRITTHVALLLFLFAVPSSRADDCIPIHQAGQHIGETRCVTGKVFRVKVGAKGVRFLDFCEDAMACPFTVVVFSNDLKDVGDVRHLAGRTIEIRSGQSLRWSSRDYSQAHQPDRGWRRHDPAVAEKLRRRKPWALQRRTDMSNQEAHEDKGQAEHHRNFWQ